ncbi:hypothetical protein Bhyg_11444 [Pseudolycoriella hygida]|uniref:RING-type domain-containing protein n=1 Tax=Pseudolycoriella hygida TaxID=35572 RepID=A0A9Q0MVD9_9DIPT|nr:hypothetical protein Bhyg_11444 [Pseudolycoriella hygida]
MVINCVTMEVLPVSLFRSDLAASWIEVPKCVRCRNLFIKTKDGNRYPCNVSCGHVLCSTCLTSIRKTEKEAKCPKCSLKLQAKDLSRQRRPIDL